MLSREAINSVVPLTAVLDKNKLMIVPVQNSPLETLVGATRSGSQFVQREGEGFVLYESEIEYIANAKDDVLKVSQHDMAMDDVCQSVADAVRGHMVFARTVVLPALTELVEGVSRDLAALTPSTLLKMEVAVVNPNPLVLDNGFETLVRKFSEVPFDNPSLMMKLPTLAVGEIVELMKTGAASIDELIVQWIAEKGDSFVIDVWENIFQMKQSDLNENEVRTLRTFIGSQDEKIDMTVAVFLLANKLFDNPPAGTEMTLAAFNDLIVDYRNQAASTISYAIDEINRVMVAKELVRSIDGSKTKVFGPVYRDWIENGGSNEVLFGNTLERNPLITVDAINESASRLKAGWDRHAALTATVEANRRFVRVKELLLINFEKQLRNLTDEEKTKVSYETTMPKFRELLNSISEGEVQDIWALCLKLLCRSRFYYSSAEEILTNIEEVKKQNPSIEVREAAAVAMIKYIARWVAYQFEVKSF